MLLCEHCPYYLIQSFIHSFTHSLVTALTQAFTAVDLGNTVHKVSITLLVYHIILSETLTIITSGSWDKENSISVRPKCVDWIESQ